MATVVGIAIAASRTSETSKAVQYCILGRAAGSHHLVSIDRFIIFLARWLDRGGVHKGGVQPLNSPPPAAIDQKSPSTTTRLQKKQHALVPIYGV